MRASAKLQVKVRRREDGVYILDAPFSQELVDLIHELVPREDSAFHRPTRSWFLRITAAEFADLKWSAADWATFDGGGGRG